MCLNRWAGGHRIAGVVVAVAVRGLAQPMRAGKVWPERTADERHY